MKKIFLILAITFLFPITAFAATTVPWTQTNLTDGFIFPNLVNGVKQGVIVSASSTINANLNVNGIITQSGGASSTFSNGINLTTGCFSIAGTCLSFQPIGNYITALTGDGTASGPGSAAFTLATVNSNVGSFTNANITVNAKGLITSASNGTASSGSGNVSTSSAETAGYVPFWMTTSGTPAALSGGTSNFVWDAVNNRLGIASSSPQYSLTVIGTGYFGQSGLPLTSIGTVFNTYTTDLTSNVVINSFQASGAAAAAGNVQAVQFNVADTGANSPATLTGLNGLASKSGSGTVGTLTGIQASARISGTTIATVLNGFVSQTRVQTGTNATTVNNFNATAGTVTGTIGTSYGFHAAAQKVSGVTMGYGFGSDGTTDNNYFLGKVGIGTTTPITELETYGTASSSILVVSRLSGLMKANGTSAVTTGTNGVDFSLITANTCTAGDFVSAVTAAGVFTCTTPAGTVYTATYPITLTGSAFGIAFGTTTSNAWANTQTFTNSPVFSTLGAGSVNSTSAGTLYNTATSTPTVTAPITYSGTLGQFIGGVSGTFGCTSASTGVTGCMTAADWALLHTATTTFSSPLVYTASTNAVTCPSCITSVTNYFTLTGNNLYNNSGTYFGIGTTTPTGLFALHANNGTSYPGNFLINVASSTASATTTMLSLTNKGYLQVGADSNAFLSLGGKTSSFAGFSAANSSQILVRLADDSAYADLNAANVFANTNFVTGAAGLLSWTSAANTPQGTKDTTLSRQSPGVVQFGTTSGNASGGFIAASSTIVGVFTNSNAAASSTITNGLNVGGLNVSGSATTTHANGISLAAGCFQMPNGTCLTSGDSGTVTNIATTYPITGGSITTTGTLALAFGTTTSNLWAGTQTFTNAPVFSALTGVLIGNGASAITAGSAQTCTNQFFRSLSGLYAVTCASVSLTADVSGILPIANGGTATSTQVTSGINYFDGTRISSNANYTLTSFLLTAPNASTTNFTVGTYFSTGASALAGIGTAAPSANQGFTIATTTVITGAGIANAIASSTTDAASETVNWDSGNTARYILSASTNFVINATSSNPRDGGRYVLILCQDNTGSRTATFTTPAQLVWAGGGTTTISSAANTGTLIAFLYQSRVSRYTIIASSTVSDIRTCKP